MNITEHERKNNCIIIDTRSNQNYSQQLTESNHKHRMNSSLSSLFRNKNWNPLIDGFKKCKKGMVTRFVFVANSVPFQDTPNRDILHEIFIQYGPLYDIFIIDDKPFANIAFVNINDAIKAYYALNGKEHRIIQRKLHLDFSEPRYPKVW